VATKRKRLHLTKSNRKYTFDDVIKAFNNSPYILLSKQSEYVDAGVNNLRYICPIHRSKGEQTISLGHLIDGKGCYYCGRTIVENARKIDKHKNEEECEKICLSKNLSYHGVFRENSVLYIKYICPTHNFIGVKNMRKTNMKRKNTIGCPYCAENKRSRGEIIITKYLQNKNIDYLCQYKFDKCKDIDLLLFDFYLPTYNMCIEFDGEHHYYPINFNGITDAEAQRNFLLTMKHDKIKDDFCKSNNIQLLRIPYYEIRNIGNILDKILN
jgi:very-short-patch-repair endonuclease